MDKLKKLKLKLLDDPNSNNNNNRQNMHIQRIGSEQHNGETSNLPRNNIPNSSTERNVRISFSNPSGPTSWNNQEQFRPTGHTTVTINGSKDPSTNPNRANNSRNPINHNNSNNWINPNIPIR